MVYDGIKVQPFWKLVPMDLVSEKFSTIARTMVYQRPARACVALILSHILIHKKLGSLKSVLLIRLNISKSERGHQEIKNSNRIPG